MNPVEELRSVIRKIRSRRLALTSSRWLALTLAGLLLYTSGVEVGYTRALAALSPLDRVDIKCRYGVQAVLGHNIDMLDRELVEYYPLKWQLTNVTIPPEELKKYEELSAQRKLYAERLEQIQKDCLRAVDAEKYRH